MSNFEHLLFCTFIKIGWICKDIAFFLFPSPYWPLSFKKQWRVLPLFLGGAASIPKGEPRSCAILKAEPRSFCHIRAMICANYGKKEVQFSPGTPEYQDSKLRLTNTAAISFYLASAPLRGGDSIYHQAQILQWVEFCDKNIQPAICAALCMYLTVPLANGGSFHKDVVQMHKKDLQKHLTFLNEVFLHNTFLVGERISLADITLFSLLIPAHLLIVDSLKLESFINLYRWFNTVHHQPEVRSVVCDVELCSKEQNKKK